MSERRPHRHFQRLRTGVDVAPFLDELAAIPDAWDQDPQRQTHVSVQRETEAVPICAHAEPVSFREARQRHPIRYVGSPTPISAELPHSLAFVQDLARRLHGIPGRAVLVRLRPHGRVYEHVDRGLYYQLRHRYHLVLKSVAGSRLRAADEEVRMREGELWWFDNRLPHDASNDSDEDRIHLIMDFVSPASVAALPARLLRSPGQTLHKLRRKLARRV